MNIAAKLLYIPVFALLIMFYAFSAAKVKEYRVSVPSSSRASAMLVAPEILEIAAGEFKGILADYLLLKASVFLGGRYKTTENDWLAVYHLFKQSLALDPYFFQTCYFIQAILPWEAKMPEKAVELLDISREHRYWDWQPGYYIGFDYFYFLKDNDKAAKQLMEAAKIPGAPRIISSLASRMAHKSGQTELAIAFLQTMYDKAKDENTRIFFQDRIKAHTGILVLEKAVLLFWQKYDYIPGSLDDLVLKGIISELPENPYGDRYIYEPKTGRVFFDQIR